MPSPKAPKLSSSQRVKTNIWYVKANNGYVIINERYVICVHLLS